MLYAEELARFKELQSKVKLDKKWKSPEERIRYHMSISPHKKLEWLYEVQQFMNSVSPKNRKIFENKLRIRK